MSVEECPYFKEMDYCYDCLSMEMATKTGQEKIVRMS